ncbi:helix-turn-helix domain-containing protein [Saccharospirillum impatiens]|uniref:helix-turn-helix domain-containing protein n=1 Tax=Saccharospirillum impatiens TaxID=169438 RepID=UPI00041EA1CE|nr:helix-turn-helix transcriptional regulator [Saccharospirillum impatiens]
MKESNTIDASRLKEIRRQTRIVLGEAPEAFIKAFPTLDNLQLAQVFSENLRSRRSALGLSQSATARCMSLSLTAYRRYETGHSLPKLHTAIRWSLSCGVPTEWLLLNPRHLPKLPPIHGLKWQPLVSYISLANPDQLHCLSTLIQHHHKDYPKKLVAADKHPLGQFPDVPTYYRLIAENLRPFRLAVGLSQSEAASLIGICEASYRLYESPQHNTAIGLQSMYGMVSALNIDPTTMSVNSRLYDYRCQQRDNLWQLNSWVTGLKPKQADAVLSLTRTCLEHFELLRVPGRLL